MQLVLSFYLVSMLGEVKEPTQGNRENLSLTNRANDLDLQKNMGTALAAATKLAVIMKKAPEAPCLGEYRRYIAPHVINRNKLL